MTRKSIRPVSFLSRKIISRKSIIIQCLIFNCRPVSRRSPARPAWLSSLLRVSVPGAFLRPAGGSCRIENLNSSVYVYHANLQLQQSHTLLTVSRGCISWTTVILYGFNFKSLVTFQAENCETPVFCDNLLRDFLGLRSNVFPISSSFSSVSTWRVLWGILSRTEPVSRNLFTNCISVRRTDIGESVSK